MNTLRDGLVRGWAVLLPLALLPVANRADASQQLAIRAALVLAALLLWVWTMVARRSPPNAVALLAHSRGRPQLGPWELVLLAVVAVIAILYLAAAARVTQISTNDGAYYYGVARHMVRTGRFEEPIVWHFIHPPARLTHAPFDYWGGMTALALAPSLALFGPTPHTAFLAMAAFAAVSVLLFWYLICFALPLRYGATQLLALLLFAFSPPMDRFRFQPESTVIAQLWLLPALIAFCRRRFVLAVVAAFALVLTRSDQSIVFALITLFAVIGAQRDGRHGWRVALTGVACVAIYVAWSAASFGTMLPPAAAAVPFLNRFPEVLEFGTIAPHGWRDTIGHFTPTVLAAGIARALPVHTMGFTPAWHWWIALAAVSLLVGRRGAAAPRLLIWTLCFVGYFAVMAIGGSIPTLFRTAHTFVPLAVLAGALGLDWVLSLLHAWVERRPGRARAALVGAAVMATCAILLARLPVLQTWPAGTDCDDQAALGRLDPILRGQPVATNSPWYVIAYTDSPAVFVPRNGEAAIATVLERYAVRWLVLFPSAYASQMEQSQPVLARILGQDRDQLGRFRLQRVATDSPVPAVYRVDDVPSTDRP